jgi:hypothetical protein
VGKSRIQLEKSGIGAETLFSPKYQIPLFLVKSKRAVTATVSICVGQRDTIVEPYLVLDDSSSDSFLLANSAQSN